MPGTVKKTASVSVKPRRRGEALENAILEAAVEELVERGYAGLTMENVAIRAGTSRPVINRRWPQRSDLAVAAVQYLTRQTKLAVPDMGSVRDELLYMLKQLATKRLTAVHIFTRQMMDYYWEQDSSPAELHEEMIAVNENILDKILERGIARGELSESRLKPRVRSLVIDLLRHETMYTLENVSDEAIIEIVDDIFLPLASAEV